ncbi:TonB-dependent receptor [Spirosoma lituiforme]
MAANLADRAITGTVVDEQGAVLPGVSIVVKGSQRGTTTDKDGAYRLTIPDGGVTLTFSFVGYLPQDAVVNNQSVVNITLKTDTKSLDEVVVVGYGTQKKADVTGATSTVTSKEFNAGVINNPLQSVQGKVAGLVIQSPNSDPTNNRPAIRLRGTSSLSANSEPLIVIDGVSGANLNSVAPEDIERVDVLKDASAAAIYGSRGANGVIVVTTKRGKSGQTQIEYNGFVGVQNVVKNPDVLSADAFRQKAQELGVKAIDGGASTNWFKEMEQTAISHNHSIGISGGSDKFTYRGSLVYLNQPGVVKNSGYDRLNARLNLTQKAFNDRLEVQLLVSQQFSNKKFVDYNAFRAAIKMNPTYPVYNADGSFFQLASPQIEEENPVARLMQIQNDAKEKQTLINGKVSLEVVKGLKIGVNASLSDYNYFSGYFVPSTFRGYANTGKSLANRNQREVIDKLIESTISYTRAFGKSNLNVLAGHTYQKLSSEEFFAENRDFPDIFGYNNLGAGNPLPDGGNTRVATSNKYEAILVGLLGRVNYSYDDKYLLTANIRRDGSSRFGANNRWGVFPSLSVGWRVSQEAFLKNSRVINDLKVRLGYGVTGNQDGIGDYASRLIFTQSGFYPTNGGFRSAYSFTQNANPDLKWETSAMTNLGFDFSLLNSRLQGSLEFYNKDTKDLLFNYPLAIGQKYGSENLTAVVNNILANVGQVNNRGVELSLTYQVIDKAKFSWQTTLNLAHNRNRVGSLSNSFYSYNTSNPTTYGGIGSGQGGFANTFPIVLQEGYPIGEFYAARFLGFDDKGNYIFQDNGGGGKDPGGKDRTYLGSSQPSLTLGWNNNFQYGNFDLNFFIRGSLGQKAINGPYILYANPGNFPGNNVLNYAFQSGIGQGVASQLSSLWLENASFIRLDNFRLGYRIPGLGRNIRNPQVYVSGQNLFVITKYRGIDPELRTGSSRDVYGGPTDNNVNLSPGIDPVSFYPRTRSFVLGVSVAF